MLKLLLCMYHYNPIEHYYMGRPILLSKRWVAYLIWSGHIIPPMGLMIHPWATLCCPQASGPLAAGVPRADNEALGQHNASLGWHTYTFTYPLGRGGILYHSQLPNFFSVHGLRWWHCTCLWSQVCGPETNLYRAWGCHQLSHYCPGQNIYRVIRLHYESVGCLGYQVIFEIICHTLFIFYKGWWKILTMPVSYIFQHFPYPCLVSYFSSKFG